MGVAPGLRSQSSRRSRGCYSGVGSYFGGVGSSHDSAVAAKAALAKPAHCGPPRRTPTEKHNFAGRPTQMPDALCDHAWFAPKSLQSSVYLPE